MLTEGFYLKRFHFLKDKDRRDLGFTAIEILIAVALSTLVAAGALSFLFYFFAQFNLFDQWSGSHQDSSLSLEQIQNDLRNIVLLNPAEDLSAINDFRYYGVATLAASVAPTYCASDANFNVALTTSLSRKKRPEKVLRVWDEIASSGKSGATHELRLTADATTDSLFNSSSSPKEITIIDADRFYTRRYKVISYKMNIGTTIDPVDDVDRAPNTFNYVSVLVENTKTVTGLINPKRRAVFVTSSEVFESATEVYCYNKNTKTIFRSNLATGVGADLFQVRGLDYDIVASKFLFAKTSPKQRLENATFFNSTFTSGVAGCINVMKIEIDLNPSAARKEKAKFQGSNEVYKKMVRSRMIFLPNLSFKRPISCMN